MCPLTRSSKVLLSRLERPFGSRLLKQGAMYRPGNRYMELEPEALWGFISSVRYGTLRRRLTLGRKIFNLNTLYSPDRTIGALMV